MLFITHIKHTSSHMIYFHIINILLWFFSINIIETVDGVSMQAMLYKQKQQTLYFNKYVTVDLHFYTRTALV